MKNKFYLVYIEDNDEGYMNMVIAPTAREAKKIGAFTEATEYADSWAEIKVKAIKGGLYWYDEENGKRIYFSDTGTGFL